MNVVYLPAFVRIAMTLVGPTVDGTVTEVVGAGGLATGAGGVATGAGVVGAGGAAAGAGA